MPNNLMQLIKSRHAKNYATDAGIHMHAKLQHAHSDPELMQRISSCPGLAKYFVPDAKTEVPIAGYIGDRFVSRRIDRMVIDRTTKKIFILDYKTDTDRETNRTKYIHQLREYRNLVQLVYSDFDIETSILWTHDWILEKI